MSLIVGFFSEFSGLFSFSRTICFFGFFLLGYYSDIKVLEKIRGKSIYIAILSIIVVIIIYVYCSSGMTARSTLARALTKSASYKNTGMSLINGFIMRGITIPISIILGMLILAYMPRKKNILTTTGRNSIIILIFHKYFIMVFEKVMEILKFNIHTTSGIVLLIIVSIGITLILSIDIFHKIYNKTMEKIERIILKE
jgi:fucose 4-O-acetylase-like acetyltransferase